MNDLIPSPPLYITEADVIELLSMPEAITAVESAFLSLASGGAANYSRQRFFLPNGVLHNMMAAWHDCDVMGTKTYTTFGGKTRFIVMLYSTTNGNLLAHIEADKLGQMRTGAATGVAAKHLAHPNLQCAALFGTGWQARSQVEALQTACPSLKTVHVFGRDAMRRETFCQEMMAAFPIEFVPMPDAESATRNAEAVLCATSATVPYLKSDWLTESTFVAAVGANRLTAREIEESVVRWADVVVVDDLEQAKHEAAELIFASERQNFFWNSALPLSQIIREQSKFNPNQKTLFKSLGIALEDIAVANLVYKKPSHKIAAYFSDKARTIPFMKAILAIDIGSSAAKAVFYSVDAGQRLHGKIPVRHHKLDAHIGGGRWTLDADMLVELVAELAADALAAHPKTEVVAVALSTFWHSFIAVDSSGEAITPISMWSDTRATNQIHDLRNVLPFDYTEKTGCPIHTSYPPARILWLQEQHPDLFKNVFRFLSPGEYLYSRLFGFDTVSASVSMASASGLYNQHKGIWDTDILGLLGLTSAHLSPLSDKPVMGLCEPYRTRLSRLASIPWFPAIGDGACSNLGCGAVTKERVALMIGTSGALRVALPDSAIPAVPEGLWRYQADAHRFLVGGALSNGGNVWDWITSTFSTPLSESNAVEAAIAALQPDGHSLTILPFLNGERAPLWQDGLKSTIDGITIATTALEIMRAYLEAVAYRFALLRDRIRPITPHAEIIGTGAGLIESPVWAQIIADTLGETLCVVDEPQASSRGAALWVREQLGEGKIEAASVPHTIATYEPDSTRNALYQKARLRQENLLKTLQNRRESN